jgi:hypothetical protein
MSIRKLLKPTILKTGLLTTADLQYQGYHYIQT